MSTVQIPARAKVRIHVERAHAYDERRGLWLRRQEEADVEAENIITSAGRVRLHTQCYATAGILSNGFNYIALTNNGTAPAPGDTVLSNELTTDGLARAQGAVTLPTGSNNQTTIENTFTYVGATQAVQKTALFTAVSGGIMAHEILFTQRILATNDTIAVTFTIQLG